MAVAAFTEPFTGPEVLVRERALTPSICARVASITTEGIEDIEIRAKVLTLRDDPALAEVKQFVTSAGRLHFNVDANAVRVDMTLLEYPPCGGLARHHDNPPKLFVCCIYLTDPSQYAGGELLIDDHPPMRPGLGNAVFIRGDVMHSVNEITRGTRHVLKASVFINARSK